MAAPPPPAPDSFSDRLTSKVLRSLEGLNASLSEVRGIVAQLSSPSPRSAGAASTLRVSDSPVSSSQAAFAAQLRAAAPPTIPTSPVLLGGAAPPATAAPAPPAFALPTRVAATPPPPPPPSAASASSSPRATAAPPATPSAIPDAAALRRLLLSPSLRGVGLDPSLLQEIGGVFDAATLAQIAAHTGPSPLQTSGSPTPGGAPSSGRSAAFPPSSPGGEGGEHVHFAKVATVAIPLAESPCSLSDAEARSQDSGSDGSGGEDEDAAASGAIPGPVAAAVGLPGGLFDDDAAAASASLRAASIRSGRSSRSGGGRSISGHSGLTPHEQDLYRDAGALPPGLSSSRRSSVYSYRSGTPPPAGSRTGASTPRSVSFRDPETDDDDDEGDNEEEEDIDAPDSGVEGGESDAVGSEDEEEDDEGEEGGGAVDAGAGTSRSSGSAPRRPSLSSGSSSASPRSSRPSVRIIKPATAGGGGGGSPRSTRSAGSTASAGGRSAKQRGFAVRFVAPAEGTEEAAAAEVAAADADPAYVPDASLAEEAPAATETLSPPLPAPPLLPPGKPFTFVRFGEAGLAPQAAEAYDDGTPADVPLLAEALSVEEFYELAAKVAEREAYRRQLAALKAEREAELAAAGVVSAETQKQPPSDPAFTIWDATPEPAVSEWRGGDAEWPCVPVVEPHGSRKHYELPTGVTASDADAVAALGRLPRFEALNLRLVYESGRTGFEDSKELVASPGTVIAGRYRIESVLGSAAFSTALGAVDLTNDTPVCLKVIKNTKDYVDQSLDEIKLLRYINAQGDADAMGVVRLFDYFYYREHLIIVTELLKDNLYELQRYLGELGAPPYFTLPRIQRIAGQVLRALAFVHGAGLIHCDLKPENILIESYSRADVKLIDFGSSSFITDKLTTYIQSRSYRAPEVILGLPYGPKIDVWSLGCILTELLTGRVLFPNESVQSILARMQAVCGAFPAWMIEQGAEAREFLLADGTVFERVPAAGGEGGEEGGSSSGSSGLVELLRPLRTDLALRCGCDDVGFLDFVASLLVIDPTKRPTAAQALAHPWLTGPALPFEPYPMP